MRRRVDRPLRLPGGVLQKAGPYDLVGDVAAAVARADLGGASNAARRLRDELEALERTERRLVASRGRGEPNEPDFVMLLTGRGPLRTEFEARAARRSFTRVAVRTAWLEPADYPVVIGMADAGICLHQSSSGRDLPIRLAEFRGCGVPVCVYDYAPVVSEVLTPGHEGITFGEPGQLATVLFALATADLTAVPAFAASREWLVNHPAERWDQAWRRVAAPVLTA
jgi:beta-1,4-mannosyltransferase